MQKTIFLILFLLLSITLSYSQQIAVLQYGGGGDWYGNPTALPNLIQFCNTNINTKIDADPEVVQPNNIDLFNYPFIHMTGHGNVYFSNSDIDNLRNYLLSGGFLHIDDNYGMDTYLRKELDKLFPDQPLTEISPQHPIFNQVYQFPNGLPKIHEHDNKKPEALGIFIDDRLVLLYTLESDLGDGWENQEIHNDPESVRLKALQMGANIISYVFSE